MKVFFARALAFGIFVPGFCLASVSLAQSGVSPAPTAASLAHDDQQPSPAQQSIDSAKRQIAARPKNVQAFNSLATAYLRRARETADVSYIEDAARALAQGFDVDPTDFQLQKTQIALLLARHRYTEARQSATLLNRKTPDDVMVYGYLAEADLALGDYPDAEKNVQWMLNMLPNNVPSLLFVSELRVLYGDDEGALQPLNQAYSETPPTEVEELAWIANRIAAIQIATGKSEAAAATLAQAEQLFPRYIYTAENLAPVRMARERPADAVALLLQATPVDKNPHVLYQLAAAQKAAGQSNEAATTFANFERLADKQAVQAENTSPELILYYAASPATTANALTVAQRAIAARHDVWTLDAYAWALFANGKFAEADAAEQKAIAVGIQDAQIFNHAGHIAQKLGHAEDAGKYFELSIRTDPTSEYASESRHADSLPGNQIQAESLTTAAPSQPSSSADTSQASLPQSEQLPSDPNLSSLPAFTAVPSALLTPQPTDTARTIRKAQLHVANNPKDATGYSMLGAAYFQHARETGDVNDYQLAEQALNKSLDLDSTNFAAAAPLQTLAEVCMGEHRFDDALNYSQRALALGSGDVSSFAVVGDADADKGEYDKATQAYARLQPPGSAPSPETAYVRDSRISYLKFISGDTDGAIRLLKTAIAEGREAELKDENLAWLYYELGEYSTQAGDVATADSAYLTALSIHPGDYRALAGLGKLRANEGKYAEAIVLYQRAIAVVPMPIFVGELGDLYTKTGNQAEAKKQYQLVEYIGLLGHINQVLHNRDLALFYADHDIKLSEALELAHKEFEVRHDIYTWDALAWALYKNGKYTEADTASKKALQFGTHDPLLLYHAGMISDRAGRRDEARNQLKEALTINPHFHVLYADVAQAQLGLLESQASTSEGPR
ncbi:MAG TPA: tetratricopeptide repeat protein [Acidisarcina sp.]